MIWTGQIKIIVALMILMGTLSVDATTCHQDKYQIGEECCPLCDPGMRVEKDCTVSTSTTCALCTEGTYTDRHNGQKECHTCSTCDSGSGLKVKQSCNSSADVVCDPLEGFFCSNVTSGNCLAAQRHSICLPGQYIKKTGTWCSDTECSNCSSGTFSDGTSTSCQPHTQCETLNLQLMLNVEKKL